MTSLFMYAPGVLKYSAAATLALVACTAIGLYAFQLALICEDADLIRADRPADQSTDPSSLMDSRNVVAIPPDYGIDSWEEVWLTSADGERLHCYLLAQPVDVSPSRPTVIFFHANAGNMAHRLPIAKVFVEQMRMNVFLLSYRGYGRSTGRADERGLKLDAQAAVQYVTTHALLQDTTLVAYGQSIGGAVAIDVVHQYPDAFRGLIVENTFLSLRDLIPSVLPLATPIARLCHQKWSSKDIIGQVRSPILFLSGGKDQLVPPEQMRRLYDLSSHQDSDVRRVWRLFPDGDHNDTVCQPGYMDAVLAFIEELHRSKTVADR